MTDIDLPAGVYLDRGMLTYRTRSGRWLGQYNEPISPKLLGPDPELIARLVDGSREGVTGRYERVTP